MTDHRSVVRFPPIAIEEARYDAISTPTVPNENTIRREDTRELGDDFPIVGRLDEEAEGSEEIEHSVEAAAPARGQPSHIPSRVPQPGSGAAFASSCQQIGRVIQSVDVEPCLGEEVRVSSLTARAIEHPCAGGQTEDLEQPRHLATIALEREEWLVLEDVVGVEVRRPPICRAALTTPQKNTGSR